MNQFKEFLRQRLAKEGHEAGIVKELSNDSFCIRYRKKDNKIRDSEKMTVLQKGVRL